jgi:plastocyanin
MVALAGGAGQPVTHEVRMSGNGFHPATVEAHAGDSVRFVNGPGGLHNIEFVADSIPKALRSRLAAAMPGEKIGPLSSPLLLSAGEVYQFRLPELPPGRYPFICLAHVAVGMRGAVIIVP